MCVKKSLSNQGTFLLVNTANPHDILNPLQNLTSCKIPIAYIPIEMTGFIFFYSLNVNHTLILHAVQ